MACLVSLQMSASAAFYASYSSLDSGVVTPDVLLLSSALVASFGYFLAVMVGGREMSAHVLFEDLKHLFVFSSVGIGLSPVLYKLTDTISTDTIQTASFIGLLTHLLTHDYLPSESTAVHYASDNALSLNASLFAAVCLASRLGSAFEAFSLLAVSVITFVLCPLLRSKMVKTSSESALSTLTLTVLCAVTTLAMVFVSVAPGFAVLAAFAHVFIVLVTPSLFVKWQDYKDTINGPWDEAVPQI